MRQNLFLSVILVIASFLFSTAEAASMMGWGGCDDGYLDYDYGRPGCDFGYKDYGYGYGKGYKGRGHRRLRNRKHHHHCD